MKDARVDRVRRAADAIHGALYPTDEVRLREGLHPYILEEWPKALRLLAEAENLLDTGVGGGEPDVRAAMHLIDQAHMCVESSRGALLGMDAEVKDAFAFALRELDALTGRG